MKRSRAEIRRQELLKSYSKKKSQKTTDTKKKKKKNVILMKIIEKKFRSPTPLVGVIWYNTDVNN